MLDASCISCHSPQSGNERAARLDLAPKSYASLLTFGGEDLMKLAFERDRSIPGECVAAKSVLYSLLTRERGHEGLHLDAESLDRLVLWMDTYAQWQGSFSEAQERELTRLRETWSDLLVQGTGGGG